MNKKMKIVAFACFAACVSGVFFGCTASNEKSAKDQPANASLVYEPVDEGNADEPSYVDSEGYTVEYIPLDSGSQGNLSDANSGVVAHPSGDDENNVDEPSYVDGEDYSLEYVPLDSGSRGNLSDANSGVTAHS